MKQAEEDRLNVISMVYAIEEYNRYFQRKLGIIQNSTGKHKKTKKGHHPFVPSHHPTKILGHLRFARDYIHKRDGCQAGVSFLDCGCGVGNIMLLATTLRGFNIIAGIEYDKETYEIARMLCQRGQIFKGDLTKFERYSDYNILYYYEPMHCPTKRETFIKKLINDTKVGTLIITNGCSQPFRHSRKFKRLNGGYHTPIFEKRRA